MIALIDNYDSFTYNIYQMISRIIADDPDEEVRVFRNDELSVEELLDLEPDRLIISPGPGTPSDAGISIDAIKAFAGKVPILGSASGIRPWPRPSAGRSSRRRTSSTARWSPSTWTAGKTGLPFH